MTWRRVPFTILPQDTLTAPPGPPPSCILRRSPHFRLSLRPLHKTLLPMLLNYVKAVQGNSTIYHSTRSPVGLSLSKRRLRIIGVRIKGSYPWAPLSQDLSSFADVWCTSGAKNIPKEIIDGFCRWYEISAKCITRPPWTCLKSLNVHGQVVSGRTVVESEI